MNDYEITKEMINNDSSWFSIVLLLFAFSRGFRGDEEQCTETTTDTTTQQEI